MNKLRSYFSATRFDFQLTVHTLHPWPAGNKAVSIGWQRGKRRRGATSSVVPLPSPGGRPGALVRFNERISFKSTLYKVRRRGRGACPRMVKPSASAPAVPLRLQPAAAPTAARLRPPTRAARQPPGRLQNPAPAPVPRRCPAPSSAAGSWGRSSASA